MKRIYEVWKMTVKNAVTEVFFCGSILLGFVLLLFGSVYRDLLDGSSYNAVSLLTHFSREELMMQEECSVYEIMNVGTILSHFWMYAPLVVLIPLITTLIIEKKSGMEKLELNRTSRMSFATGRFLGAFTVGGMTLFGSVCLYGIYVMAFYYQGEMKFGVTELLILSLKYFLYGGISIIPGYLVAVFCQNIYLFTCIPFIINYLWNIGFTHKYMYWEEGILKDIAGITENISALSVNYFSHRKLLFFLVYYSGISVLLIALQMKRWKSGEV